MQFLLDTADLATIEKYYDLYPIYGVTTNPSILAKTAPKDVFEHLRTIRSMIGKDAPLHAQVIGQTYDEMLDDAATLLDKVDANLFVKIPTNEQGLKAMKELKRQGVHVTATAIYSKMQGFTAIAAGADVLAPYFNRMQNLDVDSVDVISALADMIDRFCKDTVILGASFKNAGQVCDAFRAGCHQVTITPDIFVNSVETAAVKKAVSDFRSDFDKVYGGKTLCQL